MPDFYYLIPIFLLVSFAWELLLGRLNLARLGLAIPEEFAEIYPQEKYRQSQDYLRAQSSFSLVSAGFQLAIFLLAYFFGVFAWLDVWVVSLNFSPIVSGLIYIGVIALLSMLLGIPFSYYSSFVIEERFGFNKSTRATFIKDQVLSLFLAVLLGGPIVALLLWFFTSLGDKAWWVAWVAVAVIQIFLSFLAPVFLLPLFNKFEPIEDGELKDAVKQYANSQDFALEGLYKMDGSKRSSKANAFFTGFGKFRRVVLFDTLIEKQSVKELVAVLAHEIGHFKCRHIHKQMLLGILQIGLMFYLMGYFLESASLSQAFGVAEPKVYTGLVFFSFLYSPLAEILRLLPLAMSRKYEFEADAFAAQSLGNSEDLVSALKKLSVDSLSNLHPHPWKVFWEYTHPPILQRIEALRFKT